MASLLGRLDIVENAVITWASGWQQYVKIAAPDYEIEWQHLIPKSNVDIIFLMRECFPIFSNTLTVEGKITSLRG